MRLEPQLGRVRFNGVGYFARQRGIRGMYEIQGKELIGESTAEYKE